MIKKKKNGSSALTNCVSIYISNSSYVDLDGIFFFLIPSILLMRISSKYSTQSTNNYLQSNKQTLTINWNGQRTQIGWSVWKKTDNVNLILNQDMAHLTCQQWLWKLAFVGNNLFISFYYG